MDPPQRLDESDESHGSDATDSLVCIRCHGPTHMARYCTANEHMLRSTKPSMNVLSNNDHPNTYIAPPPAQQQPTCNPQNQNMSTGGMGAVHNLHGPCVFQVMLRSTDDGEATAIVIIQNMKRDAGRTNNSDYGNGESAVGGSPSNSTATPYLHTPTPETCEWNTTYTIRLSSRARAKNKP